MDRSMMSIDFFAQLLGRLLNRCSFVGLFTVNICLDIMSLLLRIQKKLKLHLQNV
jgi:hypothetical protein